MHSRMAPSRALHNSHRSTGLDHVAAPGAEEAFVEVGRIAKVDAQLPLEARLGAQLLGVQRGSPVPKPSGLVMRLLSVMLLIGRLTSLSGRVPVPETGGVLHQPLREQMS